MAHSQEVAVRMIKEIVRPLTNELLSGRCRFLPPRKPVPYIWYGSVYEHRRIWGYHATVEAMEGGHPDS